MEMKRPLRLVDAHHHLWDLDHHEHDWLMGDGWPCMTDLLGDYSALRRSYLIGEMARIFRNSNVVKSVHIQVDWVGDPVDETRWLQTVADQNGFPQAIVAFTDLTQRWAQAELERHCESANMRGIRMTHMRFHPDLLIDISFLRNFRHLGRLGLSYDLSTTWDKMPQARDLASRFPDTQIVLTHLGVSNQRGKEYFEAWRQSIRLLAEAPNVAVKVSGLGMTDHRWMEDSIRPWILDAIEIFGIDRCLFGSNWPVDGLYSSYERLVQGYDVVLGGLSSDERDRFYAGNAERVYRI
jgi:predicted TIM-barrel fold metal-dependent hydrolase